ncbi:MAG: phenylacetate--CoA ligase family protein [Chloroflexota bacterium]
MTAGGAPRWSSSARAAALDALLATRDGPEPILRRQRERFAEIVAFARRASPVYRDRYRDLPDGIRDPGLLPPVSKRDLMPRFDDWVTDPAVTRAIVDDWISRPETVGHLLLGRYLVATTSGSTGHPAIVLLDAPARAIANAERIRGAGSVPWGRVLAALVRERGRVAAVVATGGHYGAAALVALHQRTNPLAAGIRVIPAQAPLDSITALLAADPPAVLSGYATAIRLLAGEQRAGRLRIRPALVVTTAETLTPEDRAIIEASCGCPVAGGYGATEAPPIAVTCRHGQMHQNADWILLEPVDADGRPVPPGVASHSALVTNLANRVQPIIRYDLGDRITLLPAPCPCGSPLPVIRVEGRTDDVLLLPRAAGGLVPVLPLALGAAIEETAGVERFQAIQSGARTIDIRLQPLPGADPDRVWSGVRAAVRAFLAAQGVAGTRIRRSPEPPHPTAGGKFRQVFRAPGLVLPPL